MISNNEYYSKWDTNKLLKAYYLIKTDTKSKFSLFIRTKLRDSLLENVIT
jgi:hypothetical protein